MPERKATLKRLLEIVRDFDTAMLTTVDESRRFHARPMHIADVYDNGTITFVISIDNELVAEFTDNNRAGITLQGENTFATLGGILCLDADSSRIADLWSEQWRRRFPVGPQDPQLRLLDFRPDVGAYWIESADGPIEELVAAGRSMIFGASSTTAATGEHGVVEIGDG